MEIKQNSFEILKIIARTAITFIPLGDKTVNSNLIERVSLLADPQSQLLLHFLV